MLSIFGPWTKRPEAIFHGRLEIGSLIVIGDRLTAAAVGVVLICMMLYLLRYTWAGKAMRAVSQDRETASIVGVNAKLTGMLAFGLGAALAGAAGALIGPVFLVYPTMGVIPAIKAYVIVVLGGLGSVPGAILGALILGQVETLATVLIPDTTRALAYKDAYGTGNESPQPYDRGSHTGPGPYSGFSAGGFPCQRPPWGRLFAVNANTGDIAWEVVLGLNERLPEGKQLVGSVGSAGPTATAGGLVFAPASDSRLRAFDSKTGKELWVERMTTSMNANPMSYAGRSGKQYVAGVVGGAVVVWALP
jgi:hypothetical protein